MTANGIEERTGTTRNIMEILEGEQRMTTIQAMAKESGGSTTTEFANIQE